MNHVLAIGASNNTALIRTLKHQCGVLHIRERRQALLDPDLITAGPLTGSLERRSEGTLNEYLNARLSIMAGNASLAG